MEFRRKAGLLCLDSDRIGKFYQSDYVNFTKLGRVVIKQLRARSADPLIRNGAKEYGIPVLSRSFPYPIVRGIRVDLEVLKGRAACPTRKVAKMYLLSNFLQGRKQYAEAEKLWRRTWSSLTDRIGQKERWKVPWFEAKFVNGTPFLDGNPIFTAVDRTRRLAVRIIQTPFTPDGEPDLISWTDKFGKGDPEELDELVISCVLSEDTLAQASELMSKWAKNGTLDDSMRPAKAQRRARSAAPRQRISRA